MKFTLDRIMNREDCCVGILSYEGGDISYVVEPRYDSEHCFVSGAIPKGEYKMEMTVNPNAGVPCIKLKSKDWDISTTIRCCKPMGKKSRSLVLAFINEENGISKEPNVKAWRDILELLTREEEHVLTIESSL